MNAASNARPRYSGSLRHRGRIWWMRYWHNGKRVEVSAETDDKAKAERKLREYLRTADTPDHIGQDAKKVTFVDLKTGIVHNYKVKKNRSTKRLEQSLAHLEAVFGADKALRITDERVQAYIDDRLAEEAEAGTINRELAALRRMFRLNRKVRRFAPNITLLDESDRVRQGFIDPADFAAFCDQLPSPIADAAWFAYLTCWRRNMVLGLTWTQVTLRWDGDQLTGGVIRLPGTQKKNKRATTVVLKGRLLDVIRRRWGAKVSTSPYVFHCEGRRLRDFRDTWGKAAEAVGRSGLLFHDLRRSAARTLRRSGETEGVIMSMGGWKTRTVFEKYNIVDESDLANAADRRDAYLDQELAKGSRTVVTLKKKRA